MPKSDLICALEACAPELPIELAQILLVAGIDIVSVDDSQTQNQKKKLDRPEDVDSDWQLQFSSRGLALSHRSNAQLQNIIVDFNTEAARFASREKVAHELLIKAVGGIAPPGRLIIDATAGLGVDSLLLARAGHKVMMLEQSPAVAALLTDGLQRAAKIGASLSLVQGNAVNTLSETREDNRPDLVYLDPMFPSTGKRALSRKGLQALKEFLPASETEADQAPLLEAALASARYRVVVKRPLRAAPLAGPAPGFTYSGKQIRYDCYALQKLPG